MTTRMKTPMKTPHKTPKQATPPATSIPTLMSKWIAPSLLILVCLFAQITRADAESQGVPAQSRPHVEASYTISRTDQVEAAGAMPCRDGGAPLADQKKSRASAKDRVRVVIKDSRDVKVTAYSAEVAQTDENPFETASGRRVREGIVAVSQDLYGKGWTFGRKVYIDDLGIFTIDDLMPQRKTNQVDVFMFDGKSAVKFGVKQLKVYLVGVETASLD